MQKKQTEGGNFFTLLASHLIIGIGTGWSILTIFVVFDFGGLRSLATMGGLEFLVYPLLAIFFAITFGSTAMGIGIMSINQDLSGISGHNVKVRSVSKLQELEAVKVIN